jgi:hypothetical protein
MQPSQTNLMGENNAGGCPKRKALKGKLEKELTL